MRQFALLLCLGLGATLLAQNALPVISNVAPRYDAQAKRLTVTYDVADAEGETLAVAFLVSDDGGASYRVNTRDASGDVGAAVAPGGGNYRLKLVADDGFRIDIQGVKHRTAGLAKLNAIKDSIERRFAEAGLETNRQDFPFGTFTGQNIIGVKAGTTHGDSAYIVNGHFDTVSDSPGADDNGSSIAALMEITRLLAPYTFKKSIRFIEFDLEEIGLVGSTYYADESVADPRLIKGMFNLESIGYFTNQPNTQTVPPGFNQLYPEVYAALVADRFRGNYITNIGDQNSRRLMAAYDRSAARYVPGLKTVAIAAPPNWATLTPDLGRSDHAPFWRKGIPALMITGGGNFRSPHYHTPGDVVGTLDFAFMSDVVKALVGAIAEEAGITHSAEAVAAFEVVVSVDNWLARALVVSPVPARAVLHLSFGDLDLREVRAKVFNGAGQLRGS